MHVLDLVLQILMAASLISGIIMLSYTISYRRELKIAERACRYTMSTLLVYSVVVRFLIIMPGKFEYMKETSLGFDLLYIAICVFYNINLFNKVMYGRRDNK
jgi:hypothetical protein